MVRAKIHKPVKPRAISDDILERMSWIQSSILLLGRVDVGAYLRRFRLKPASATDDLRNFAERVRAGGAASQDFDIKRGIVRGHLKRLIYPEVDQLEFLEAVHPEAVVRIGAPPIIDPDLGILRDVITAILDQRSKSGDRERLKLLLLDPEDGEVHSWMTPHAIINANGVCWVRVYNHDENTGSEVRLACILDIVDSSADRTAWGSRDAEWTRYGSLRLSLNSNADGPAARVAQAVFGIADGPKVIEGRVAILHHLQQQMRMGDPGHQVDLEIIDL